MANTYESERPLIKYGINLQTTTILQFIAVNSNKEWKTRLDDLDVIHIKATLGDYSKEIWSKMRYYRPFLKIIKKFA